MSLVANAKYHARDFIVVGDRAVAKQQTRAHEREIPAWEKNASGVATVWLLFYAMAFIALIADRFF